MYLWVSINEPPAKHNLRERSWKLLWNYTTNLNELYVSIAKLILSHNIASKHLISLYSNVRQEFSALMTVLIFSWGRRHQRVRVRVREASKWGKGLLGTVWGHTHPPDLWALFSIHQHRDWEQDTKVAPPTESCLLMHVVWATPSGLDAAQCCSLCMTC